MKSHPNLFDKEDLSFVLERQAQNETRVSKVTEMRKVVEQREAILKQFEVLDRDEQLAEYFANKQIKLQKMLEKMR